MYQFRWISSRELPASLDLREHGWALMRGEQARDAICLIDAGQEDRIDLTRRLVTASEEVRRTLLVCGVDAPEDRARLLRHGVGDVVGSDISGAELDGRARRLADQRNWVPRWRTIGTLELDLMARTASYDGRPLALHPREFMMLWRLADTPEEPVSRETLIADIWSLGTVPESNSIAVQISRLRAKLGTVGLASLVVTVTGGYRMCLSVIDPVRPSFHVTGMRPERLVSALPMRTITPEGFGAAERITFAETATRPDPHAC